MASTELGLKRTLTDILEDELYHLNNKNSGVYSSHYQYPVSNKAYMANLNQTTSNNNNQANNYLDETLVTIEPEKLSYIPESGNYVTASNLTLSPNNKKETDVNIFPYQNHQQQYDNKMFNKYADPSLTTTSIASRANSNRLPTQMNTPVVATINMKKLLKTQSPNSSNTTFIPTQTNTKNNTSSTASRDILGVKILHDSVETQEINDSYLYFDDESFVPKVHYSLEDNNIALNNEDAKLLFDDEFSDDDDFDDDSKEYDIDDDEVISSIDIEKAKNVMVKTNNLYSFVDTHEESTPKLTTDDNEIHLHNNSDILDGENLDDDNALLDEDEMYQLNSMGKIVVSADEIKELNRSKSLSLSSRPKIRSSSTMGQSNKSRKPLTHINGNTFNGSISSSSATSISKANVLSTSSSSISSSSSLVANTPAHKEHSKKHKTYLGSDLSGTNTNEIFTCRLVNLITKEPCSAQFSRSYDLTRHQNTIHAKKKIVFRCSECMKMLGNEGYEKTFSRLDALTRHIKSKHENLTAEERQRVTKYAKENIGYATA
ncbi:similar to Saccharomyces cerevisiae YDL020C RPN4 Transcription factor that stimulates expression of proteasome genes [Maudiozyma saulgeensis]|uniref:Similar to Saccharomyces cerevisiae YDL020C RPN4 Transcription factor that stimulates expression of proteasome genes n=1 Tax=Maudiozyma saulgeensis TaxID=1789683 RepID=A0A1X7R496_9SACH|nr:similar to Saccharomyces cerevisiae YDL020C RPN4 Transcription factor that stimulates expression of proteasome genes [Kazachstania saulgeensis]